MKGQLKDTQFEAATLREVFTCQQAAFHQHAPLESKTRIEALEALLGGIVKYEDFFAAAIQSDFGRRSAYETRILEIVPLIDEIRHTKRHLRKWMRTRTVRANWQFLPSRAKIVYQPLGVAGIIGAWNYPLLLTLSPLVGALAAGNHVMIKPSELAPVTAALLQQMIGELFPEEYVSVVTGDREVSAAFAALPFDHLLFTGSNSTGKLVMQAATGNLTPVTLELGGKSPALVHESYSMQVAADRICTAKLWNAGQTCVAPDYALVPAHRRSEFLRCAEAAVAKRWPRLASNPDYTCMIHELAWRRMRELVDDAAAKGAEVIEVNPAREVFAAKGRIFPPTLVFGADSSMRLMQEEIFGPILPVITYSTLEDALVYLNKQPRPLALYYFDNDSSRQRLVMERTVSGGMTINDCIFHLPQHELPFGGVGPSGMGAYHGFDGFQAFSKKKGVLVQSALTGWFLSRMLKPPYGRTTDRILSALQGRAATGRASKMTLRD